MAESAATAYSVLSYLPHYSSTQPNYGPNYATFQPRDKPLHNGILCRNGGRILPPRVCSLLHKIKKLAKPTKNFYIFNKFPKAFVWLMVVPKWSCLKNVMIHILDFFNIGRQIRCVVLHFLSRLLNKKLKICAKIEQGTSASWYLWNLIWVSSWQNKFFILMST